MAQDNETVMNQEGTFRGTIREYGSRKTERGAIQFMIVAAIEEQWDHQLEAWVDWREYKCIAHGDLNIVKTDGTINKIQAQSLVEHAGWDGDFTSVARETWKPLPCQFVIKQDVYRDETRYRISWINAYDRTPGGFTPLDANTAKDLQNRLGGEMRALVGNMARQERKPTGAPAAPPKASAPPTSTGQDQTTGIEAPADDIPF